MTEGTKLDTDTSDMFAVHQVFRRALGGANDLLADGADAGADRVELLTSYYANVLAFLESHHDAEDTLVFPLLLERCTADHQMIADIAGQHEPLVDTLTAARTAVTAYATHPDSATRQEAAATLTELDRQLTSHLDQEEELVLPIASDFMTPEEWGALPGHGMAHFTGDKVWLILGLIRENMTDDQRAAMLAHMPPPAVEMWQGMGNAAFDTMIAAVRQTPAVG